jgi:hypothetical protein
MVDKFGAVMKPRPAASVSLEYFHTWRNWSLWEPSVPFDGQQELSLAPYPLVGFSLAFSLRELSAFAPVFCTLSSTAVLGPATTAPLSQHAAANGVCVRNPDDTRTATLPTRALLRWALSKFRTHPRVAAAASRNFRSQHQPLLNNKEESAHC